jgi:hypothetical protein
MTLLLNALSLAMLSAFIWVVVSLLPRAVRERDWFAIVCALLTAIIALLGWLLIGTPAQSGG